jgi:hypothetical protein
MKNFTVTLLIVLSWWRVAVSMDGCADPDSLGDVIASNICDVDTIDGLAIFVVFLKIPFRWDLIRF